ncbi:MAG: VCBS repeat-containing protein, partial [Bacteroidetes bacterium]
MRELFIFLIVAFYTFNLSAQNFNEAAAANGIAQSCGDCQFGGGVSFADFNGDGLDDLTFATEVDQEILFYQNTGSGFQLIPPLVQVTGQTKQILWVDYDNDGDKDLFVACFECPNRLFLNEGAGGFTDITMDAGLPVEDSPTYSVVFGDVNNDGWLDLYVSSYTLDTDPGRLYRNNGNNTFTDITGASNIMDDNSLSLSVVFFDYNNDGLQDLHIANDKDYQENKLFENTGDGIFVDVSVAANVNITIDAMNGGIGDYDNNGYLDIYVTNEFPGNALLKNNGDGTFTDVASSAGVEFNQISWGGNFFDGDNDLDLDLYVSGSYTDAEFTSVLYVNENNGNNFLSQFLEGDTLSSFANAIGDFNLDGLLDIAVSNSDYFESTGDNFFHLWQNTTSNANNWLKVFLVGTDSNREGIGSWIEMYINGQKY